MERRAAGRAEMAREGRARVRRPLEGAGLACYRHVAAVGEGDGRVSRPARLLAVLAGAHEHRFDWPGETHGHRAAGAAGAEVDDGSWFPLHGAKLHRAGPRRKAVDLTPGED